MLNKLSITNYLGQKLVLDILNFENSYIYETDSTGAEIKTSFPYFIVAGISGIEASDADINFTDITTNDGGLYNSARISTRDISISLIYAYGYGKTIEEIRHESYKYFPVKKEVTLAFESDTRSAKITGYTKSNSISVWSSMEGSSLTITCPNPYFESTSENASIDFSGIQSLFAFRTQGDSAYISLNETPVFGDIQFLREKVVVYTGDSETGFVLTIHALGSIGNITFYNRVYSSEQIVIDAIKIQTLTGSGIISGDTITISTLRGSKTATLLRNGTTTNIINCLGKSITWMQLRKGDNVFAFSATSGAENAQINLEASVLYEGM